MALKGTLVDMPYRELFSMLRVSHKHGVLTIQHESYTGMLYIADGQIIDATLSAPRQGIAASGEDALTTMLQWPNGFFLFQPLSDVALRPRRITLTSGEIDILIMRSALKGQQLPADIQLFLQQRIGSEPIKLSLDQWRLLSQITPGITLATLHATLPELSQTKINDLVRQLARLGIISLHQPVLVSTQEGPRPAARALTRRRLAVE